MQEVIIVYLDKRYSIGLTSFNKHSKLFSNSNNKNNENFEINFNSDIDCGPIFTKEIIDAFIHYIKDEDTQINDSNAITLNYLSEKYLFENLFQKTKNYINIHYYNLINKVIDISEHNEKYEERFLIHFRKFYKDNRLLKFPVPIIYRLLSLYLKSETQNSILERIDELIHFLNACIKEKVSESLILLELFQFKNNYFLNDQVSNKINFFSEFDFSPNHSLQSIKSFIQFIQYKNIQISNSNVITLNYLSRKFNVHKLIKKTENYIRNNYRELIDDFLNRKEIKNNERNEKIEEILSNHFNLFFKDDRLIKLPIVTLYRIMSGYFNSKGCTAKCEEMIDFLFKYMKEKGNEASILFTTVKWNAKSVHYMNNKMKENKFELQTMLHQCPGFFFEYIEYQETENRRNCKKIEKLTKQISNMRNSYEKRFQALENKFKKQNEQLIIHDSQIVEEQNLRKKQIEQIEKMRIEQQNLFDKQIE